MEIMTHIQKSTERKWTYDEVKTPNGNLNPVFVAFILDRGRQGKSEYQIEEGGNTFSFVTHPFQGETRINEWVSRPGPNWDLVGKYDFSGKILETEVDDIEPR